jgi:hypothetical protein
LENYFVSKTVHHPAVYTLNNLITQPVAGMATMLQYRSLSTCGNIAMVLMGRETIIFVNILLCSTREMMISLGFSGIASPLSAGPWIPILPGSEQGQDLSEDWQEEAY